MSREYEQSRLNEVLKMIRNELAEISASIDFSNGEIRRQNRDMWENAPVPSGVYDTGRMAAAKAYLDELAQSNRALAFRKKRYGILLKMLQSAYFGKILFAGDNIESPEQVYIGIGTIMDPDSGEIEVYDWRAPICSLFYDADLGRVSYPTPEGIATGELVNRLQFTIENDRIIQMVDTAVKIDDEVLLQILAGHSGSRMKSIVSSIQKEQNRIIRDENNEILIASGPAGSGKTSVAMHRIAYLLYREKQNLSSSNILILTPNNIFSEYISTVLPQLGEENVSETTLAQFTGKHLPEYRLQTYGEYMEAMLSGRDSIRLQNIKVKTSEEFLALLDAYIAVLKTDLFGFSDICVAGKVVVSAEEIRREYAKDPHIFNPAQRIRRISARITGITKKLRLAEFEHQYKRIMEADDYHSSNEAKRMAKTITDEVFADADRQAAALEQTDWPAIYLEAVKTAAPEVYALTKEQHEGMFLLYEDIAPYAYFLSEMGVIQKNTQIRHVIADELQDHPVINIKLLFKLFPEARFTMLGDPDQKLAWAADSFDPVSHAEISGGRRSLLVTLTKCYRSSHEIFEFCRRLLPGDRYGALSVARHEKTPELADISEIGKKISEFLSGGCATVAVIAKTLSKARKTYELLSSQGISCALIAGEDAELDSGVIVMPSYYAKGLEFDGVVVPDADEDCYKTENDRFILYAVCSRALHRLAVCHEGTPSPFVIDAMKSIF